MLALRINPILSSDGKILNPPAWRSPQPAPSGAESLACFNVTGIQFGDQSVSESCCQLRIETKYFAGRTDTGENELFPLLEVKGIE